MGRLRADLRGALGRVDPGLRRCALLGRLGRERRVGAALRRGRGCRGRQLLPLAHARGRAARRLRGQPGRARRSQGHRRQPELHDDADRGRARPDPPQRGHRARGDVELPGGLGHGPEGRQRAERAGAGGGGRERAAAAVRLSAPDRLQRAPAGGDLQGRRRLHDRGAQVHARDAQDPRRRGRRRVGHVRARACLHGPLRVGERADARRRSHPRSAASCWPPPRA